MMPSLDQRIKGGFDRRVGDSRASHSRAIAACGDALDAMFKRDAAMDALRDPVSIFAQEAHRQGLPPERAIALFKATLFQRTEFERKPLDQRIELMRQLVVMVIEEYYDTRRR